MAPKGNTLCYFDVTIGGEDVGRIVFELFTDILPKTSENFRCLCTGEKGTGSSEKVVLHYKGCTFHRIVKNFIVQGGDFTDGNGVGGESIYGKRFDDEGFTVKHDKAGLLSMANCGPNGNGSQFFITTVPTPHLDKRHVVFGKVIAGMNTVRALEDVEMEENQETPKVKCVIKDCGELPADFDPSTVDKPDELGDAYYDNPEDGPIKFIEENKELVKNIVKEVKEFGNTLFKAQKYKQAKKKYRKARRYLEKLHHELKITGEEEKTWEKELLIPLSLNVAACDLKLGLLDEALDYCGEVLYADPENAKAMFRSGQAQKEKKEWVQAEEWFRKALERSPEDSAIKREMELVQTKIAKRNSSGRSPLEKMFK
ncbi:hypothetical protein BaRGS_00012348 [Batillaria attramentaria]|uniref:peptidylprolyl isomerase n=1 Tax=Batillaria attramentaria TaxID=370345 RepID=A0ABD0LAY9_9CAEN